MWQYAAAIGGVLVAYMGYKYYSNGAAASTAAAPAATDTTLPDSGISSGDIGSTISGQLTNLTGQVGALQNQVAGLSPATGATPTTAAASSGNVITDLYQNFTGGAGDTAGVAYWNSVLGNQTLGQTEASFEAASGANQLNAGSFNPAGFVTEQYQTALGRSPDAAGLASWEGQLTQGGAVTAQNIQAESAAFNASAAKENAALGSKG